MDNTTNNKRIAKNTLLLYFRMILTMAVSLYTSRIVLNTLGIEDFGIYNVVGGVVTSFGFLNSAMISATQRFLAVNIGKKDNSQLGKTFNAIVLIQFGIALLIGLLAETVGLWFLRNHLSIPIDRMDAAIWIYHLSVITFMIAIIQVPFNAIIIARERLSIYAYVSVFEVSLKLAIVFLLTTLMYDKLQLYSFLTLLVTLIVAIIYLVYSRKHFIETRFKLVKDLGYYKLLISYSGWNLLGNIAVMAKSQGTTILLNVFFGPVVNAAQGVANQVNAAVYSFVSNFQMASNPQITKSHAIGDLKFTCDLIIRTAKFSFLLLFIMVLPVVIEIDYILSIWLGNVPQYTANFTILVLFGALVDAISGPLVTAVHAAGKIKFYQIFIFFTLILILPVSYILLKYDYPPTTIFLITIFSSVLALVVRLFFTKKEIPTFPITNFLSEVILRNLPVIVASSVPLLIIKSHMSASSVRLLIIIFSSLITCSFSIYFLGFSRKEKYFVAHAISSSTRKIFKIN